MKIKKIMIISFAILMILIGLWTAWGYFSSSGLEGPKYTVNEQKNGYEIRKYESYIIAEVEVENTGRKGLNNGFILVADYIFGNNTKQDKIAMTAPVIKEDENEKIAMTAPVVSENSKSSFQKVSFVMPSKYNLETLPTPNNSRVKIKEIPEKKVAVIRFGGFANEKKVEQKTNELTELLKRDNLKYNRIQTAYYNDPWTPPYMRRNEVWAILEE